MGLFMAGLPSVSRFLGKSGGGFRSPSLPPPVLAGSGSKGLGNRPISVHHRLGEGGRPWDYIDLAPGKTEVKEYQRCPWGSLLGGIIPSRSHHGFSTPA